MKLQSAAVHTRTAIVIVLVVLFVLLAGFASNGVIGTREATIFHWFYDLPAQLRLPMLLITQAGSTWMVVIVTCVLLALRKRLVALQILAASLATFFMVEMTKVMVGRPRPFVILSGVQSRERFVDGLGFPSGHTAVTAVVVLLLWKHVPPRYRWLLVLWLGLVSISRMYLGVHAPLDIVGGLALGFMMYELFRQYWGGVIEALKLTSHRKRLAKKRK